jgi:four helix bundle protein
MKPRKGDDIARRLIDFAVEIGKLIDKLPDTRLGRHLAGQLVRCGSTSAFHYAEARSAESRKDFVHKLSICLKELEESDVCLQIVKASELLPPSETQGLLRECGELRGIIGQSIITAKSRPA